MQFETPYKKGAKGSSVMTTQEKSHSASRVNNQSYFNCKPMVEEMNSRVQGKVSRKHEKEYLLT